MSINLLHVGVLSQHAAPGLSHDNLKRRYFMADMLSSYLHGTTHGSANVLTHRSLYLGVQHHSQSLPCTAPIPFTEAVLIVPAQRPILAPL